MGAISMLAESLQKLGFSPSETKTFLFLLEKGPQYANKISFETGLNRTNVYEALDRLTAKGVVSFVTKNNVKYFQAKEAEALQSFIKGKEDELRQTKETVLIELARLAKPSLSALNGLEASIFVGKNGLRILLEEMLAEAEPISLLASNYQFKALFSHYFDQWHKRRVLKKIRQRTILSKKWRQNAVNKKFLQFKFVDDQYASPTSTFIYGDKCVLVQWAAQPFAIRIQSKEIAQSHLNYFNMLWDYH
jgi:sugar-specific transcriptional regulator TrmB